MSIKVNLIEPISCHSFSHDRTQVAISPSNNKVHIYEEKNHKFCEKSVLEKHGLRITSIDWAPKSNKIVTCSADKNAYVWNYANGEWSPTWVVLRFHKAATVVRWSPNENKFAVGSGDKKIAICFFEKAQDWWISMHVKKPKSTVTCLDWHPNNTLIGCGSTDFKTRIFVSFIKGVDDPNPPPSAWTTNKSQTNNYCIGEWPSNGLTGGWVHDVAFSPNGNHFAWVSHDSTVNLVHAKNISTVVTLKSMDLPYLSLTWLSTRTLIAAGYDCCPVSIKYNEAAEKLEYGEKLDKSTRKETDGFSAMRKFRDMDKFAISLNDHTSSVSDSGPETTHQNSIKEIRPYARKGENVVQVSSVGFDGKLVVWDVSRYV